MQESGGEIDVVRIVRTLWGYKTFILVSTSIFVVAGMLYALLATPIYYSQAILAPKDVGNGGGGEASGLFSQFRGIRAVGSQFGMGNAGLDKMEVLLKGYGLADAVIKKNDLLPTLFPKRWNAATRSWRSKDPAKIPTVWDGIKLLREDVLVISPDQKKGMVRLGVNWPEPRIAERLVTLYLTELNAKLRDDIVSDAEANRAYLEKQLYNTSDPFLKEKVQSMISFEIEKSMLVSTRAFEVLETPMIPVERAKPKRKNIVLLAFAAGFVFSILGVLGWRGVAALR